MACITNAPVFGFDQRNVPAWDGGARSVISFLNNGYFRWSVPTAVAGAVVGINTNDTNYHFSDIEFGFKFTRDTFQIIESGSLKGAPAAFVDDDFFYVYRLDGDVLYIKADTTTYDARYPGLPLPGPILYVSSRQSFGTMFLDASLYEVSDYVFNESGGTFFIPASDGPSSIQGEEAFIAGALPFTGFAAGSDTLGAFDGSVAGELGFGITATGSAATGVGDGILPFTLWAGDNLRGWVRGKLPFTGGLGNGWAGSDGLQDGIGAKVRNGVLGFELVANGGVLNPQGVFDGQLPFIGVIAGTEGAFSDPELSNVSLLLHFEGANGSSTFTDSSPTPKTATLVGSPTIEDVVGKDGTSSMDVTASGTGISFVNSGQEIFDMTTDTTFEATIYVTTLANQSTIADTRTGTINNAFTWWVNLDGSIQVQVYNNAGGLTFNETSAAGVVSLNTLHDVALVFDGTQVIAFVDGAPVIDDAYFGAAPLNNSNPLTIGVSGQAAARPLTGYIDEFRVTDGVARYSGAFVGDPEWANVEVFIDAEDPGSTYTNRADGGSTLTTIGGAPKTAVSPLSGTKSYESGTTDGIEIDTPPDFGTGDLTIEMLVRFDVGAPNLGYIFDSQSTVFRIERNGSGNLDISIGSYVVDITSSGSFTVGNGITFHLAVSRVAGQWRAFYDGTQFGATVADASAVNFSGGTTRIGSNFLTNFGGMVGKMDLIRVTSSGRYASNFTAPTGGDTLPIGPDDPGGYTPETGEFPDGGGALPEPLDSFVPNGQLPFELTAFSAMLSGNYLGIVLPAFTGGAPIFELIEEEISDILAMADALQTLGMNEEDIAETFTATESIVALYAFALREEITVTTELRQFIQQAVELLDDAGISDRVTVAMVIRIAEIITAADLWTEATAINLAEQLAATDLVQTFYQATEIITSAMVLVDLARAAYATTVSSSVTASDEIALALAVQALINDAMTLSDSTENQLYLMAVLSDDMNIADSSELTAQYFAEILDSADILALLKTPAELAQGWVMNTEGAMPVSEYDNYTFNSLAYGPAGMIGTSDEGIFSLDADDDAGADIDAEMTSMMLDFATSRQKRLSAAWVGYSSTGELVMKVRAVDMNEQVEYCFVGRNVGDAPAPRDNRFKLGKGLRSRYWQFELVNKDGADFEIDQVELYPIRLDRRV
jgi:hypothetical protein